MKQGLDSGPSCRLLQLDGPPQSLAFSNNSGDLVLALGSRLCLVSHELYLPTSYLVKVYSEVKVVEVRLAAAHNKRYWEHSSTCFFRNSVRRPLMW